MPDTTVLDDHPLASGAPSQPARRMTFGAGPLGQGTLATLDWRQAAGAVALIAGVIAVFVAWFGVSGTLDPGKQMPYLVSGGLGGAALIAVGMTLFLSLEHAQDRAALGEVLDRLEALERRIDGGPISRQPQESTNGTRGPRAASARTGR